MIWVTYLLAFILILTVILLIYSYIVLSREKDNLKIAYEEKFKYLVEITKSLQETLKLDRVFIKILNTLSEKFDYKPVFIYLIEKSSNNVCLRCIACPGVVSFEGLDIYNIIIEDKNSPIFSMIENKKIITKFSSSEFTNKIKLSEMTLLPIISRNRTIGLLVTKRLTENQDLLPLTIFINEAGLAIENAQLFEKVEELSILDALTGVYNRRYFDKQISLELELAKRYKSCLSLGMIDIDDFKHYNDTNGHTAGDECLKQIASIITSMIRSGDTVARYGGEEFVVILPATDKDGSLIACQKILKAIETNPFKYGEKQPLGRVTVSIGIATFPTDAQDSYALVNSADKSLYQAKTTGKNRIGVA